LASCGGYGYDDWDMFYCGLAGGFRQCGVYFWLLVGRFFYWIYRSFLAITGLSFEELDNGFDFMSFRILSILYLLII
jgi:hypothetical protein